MTTLGADPEAKAREVRAPVRGSIWDVPEYGGRGPRPKHSRAAIAAAAVSLADAEGIDAVTMRRVAAAGHGDDVPVQLRAVQGAPGPADDRSR